MNNKPNPSPKREKKVKKRKVDIKSNVIQGYDEKGNLTMYYWQKEPIKTNREPFLFKIPLRKKLNPIWRIQQWWWSRTIIYGAGEKFK